MAGSLEAQLFRSHFEPGLLDLFAGLVVFGVGLAFASGWLALVGVVPAVLVPLYVPARRRWIAPRVGVVRFSPERERRVRGGMRRLWAAGVVTLAVVAVLGVALRVAPPEIARQAVAGLPAAILGLVGLVAAVVVGLPRLAGYGLVLVAASGTTIALGRDPGPGLIIAGGILLVAATWRIGRFLRTHPVLEEAT